MANLRDGGFTLMKCGSSLFRHHGEVPPCLAHAKPDRSISFRLFGLGAAGADLCVLDILFGLRALHVSALALVPDQESVGARSDPSTRDVICSRTHRQAEPRKLCAFDLKKALGVEEGRISGSS